MKKSRYRFIICSLSFGIGFFLGGKMLVNMINDYKFRMKRNFSNMLLFNDWLHFIYSGGDIEKYFMCYNYNKIIIYGNGYAGKILLEALSESEIEVVAIMDKKITSLDEKEGMIGINTKIPDADCIVVTPVFYYEEIYNELLKKTDIPIISIRNIIEKMEV